MRYICTVPDRLMSKPPFSGKSLHTSFQTSCKCSMVLRGPEVVFSLDRLAQGFGGCVDLPRPDRQISRQFLTSTGDVCRGLGARVLWKLSAAPYTRYVLGMHPQDLTQSQMSIASVRMAVSLGCQWALSARLLISDVRRETLQGCRSGCQWKIHAEAADR